MEVTGLRVDVGVDVLEVPFRAPMATSDRSWTTRRLALVRLTAEDGTCGISEVAAGGPGGLSAADAAELAARLAGLGPAEPKDLHRGLLGLDRASGVGPAIRSALETAAADLAARQAGCSLAASATVEPRGRVLVNGLLGIAPPAVAAGRAAALRADGFGCLKLKVGGEPSAVLAERIRAVRNAVGSSVRLRVDVNGAWSSLSEALESIRAVAAFDLEYVEQPLPAALGPEALAALRRAAPVPIAADESVTDPEAAFALLEAQAADVLVVKPARVGGFGPARRIAERAAAAGVATVVSTLFETGVGLAAALHLAATLPDDGRAHGLATADLLVSDLLDEPLAIVDGRMPVPTGPGLGVDLDPTAVERFRVR